jgi:hypothetical protein
VSIFHCAGCDNYRDADDGCDEAAPGSHELICVDCMEERDAESEEAEDRRRANPLEPDFRRLG